MNLSGKRAEAIRFTVLVAEVLGEGIKKPSRVGYQSCIITPQWIADQRVPGKDLAVRREQLDWKGENPGMDNNDILKLAKTMLVSLLFFSPIFIWFALAIAGITGNFGSQERFDHISGMITLACMALYLLLGIAFVIPKIWNGELPEHSLLKKGRRAKGYLVKLGECTEPVEGSPVTVLLQIEIEEGHGRYLTAPAYVEVPPDVLSLLRPGMELPLRVNPGNRFNFAVDWESLLPEGR